MTDSVFTEYFKLFIDNDERSYHVVRDMIIKIVKDEDNKDYATNELSRFLEEEIFDNYCSCSDENLLLIDMIDAAKTEIDFDGLAQGYIDEIKEEAS